MKTIKTSVPFSTKYPIVDVEISNDISSNWDSSKGEISVAGFLVDNEITQFLLINKSKLGEFRNQINDFLSTVTEKQLYAFNIKMETGCFEKLLSKSLVFREIKPKNFRAKGFNKDYCFGYLIKQDIISKDFIWFEDPLKGNGRLCMNCWSAGEFEKVRLHNVCCLLKEAKILQHKDFLEKQLSPFFKEDGWLKDGVSLPPL